MDQPIIVRYQATENDYCMAQLVAIKGSIRPLYRALLYLIIVLILASAAITFSSRQWAPFGLTILFLSVAISYTPLGSPLNNLIIRRRFRRRPNLSNESEWQFTPDKIISHDNQSHTEVVWERVIQLFISKNGVLLYLIPQLGHWLPRHAFQDDAAYEAFVALVKSKVAKVVEVK